MLIVRFFSNFCSSDEAMNKFIKTSDIENDPDYNKKYTFTTKDNYTHAILLNNATPKLTIPPKCVIGLAHEPIEILPITTSFISYAKQFIGKYFIGNKRNLGEPFIERCGYLWHWLPELKEKVINKPKKMSIMVSKKKASKGHKYRHSLVNEILNSDLEIDIYGNGCKYFSVNDKRLKGEFDCSKKMLDDYEYHICIENNQSPEYFSEKVINPLLCNTIPIYLGSKNIEKYFGDMVIKLSGNLIKDMELIRELHGKNREKEIDLQHVKEKISIKNVINEFLNV